MPRAQSSLRAGPQRALGALAVAGAAMIAVLAIYAALRVPYPFELEWMEGAMVDHAVRVRQGLGLYVEPGPDHVPFLYTPLFFYLGALLGGGLQALRLLALLATAASALVLLLWVRRATGSARAGLCAAGLFCGGYGYLDSWYDLARNDTLMLALLLAAGWLLATRPRRPGALAAAVLLAALAFLAKQTALIWLPALALGAFCLDRRAGLWFALGTAAAIAALTLGHDLLTDGWFTFYVFEMPRQHGSQPDRWLGFWIDDLLPIAPLLGLSVFACCARWRAGRRGEALFLAAFGGGGLLASWLSRLHLGGHDNVLLFALAAGCLLAPIGALSGVHARTRWLGLGLLALQFVLLVVDPRSLWTERPLLMTGSSRFLPTAAHRQASEELVGWLRQVEGDVFVPFHGNLAALAGKPRTAHAQAMFDIMQVFLGDPATTPMQKLLDPEFAATLSPRMHEALTGFFDRFLAAFRGRFSALVLDLPHGPVFEAVFAAELHRWRRAPAPPIGRPPDLRPAVGMRTASPYALLPR